MTRLAVAPNASLLLKYANRHGLITGATGKGKSSTVATLSEGFSAAGVPSLVLDVKGDLAGLARCNPAALVDPFGATGRRVPLDLWRLGPDLIARALDLSEAQSGALDVAFTVAQARGLPLSDLSDLKALMAHCATDRETISADYGLVSQSSLAAVQRAALRLDRDGSAAFGSPGVDVASFMDSAAIAVVDASHMIRTPGLYAAWVTFVLGDLFDRSPEVGDIDRPRMVAFVDEAHLIFEGAAPGLVRRLEMITRLIRSKGVGIYFASQSPADLPSSIAAQLQNRFQHGLHGVTPADQRAIRAAADTLPVAPGVRAYEAIGSLGVGAALVSLVGPDGTPGLATVCQINRPRADLRPLSPAERHAMGVRPWVKPEPAPLVEAVEVEHAAAPRPKRKGMWWKVPLAVAGLAFMALLLMPTPPV